MRKKQPMFSKSDLKFIGWVFAIMLLCCLPFLKVYGASYNHLKYFSNSSRLDSVIIIITEDGTPTSTTVIGTDTTLVLNDIYDYYLQYLWFWDGLDEYVTDGEYIKFTAGVATVDYDSIQSLISTYSSGGDGDYQIMFYVIDTSGTNDSVHRANVSIQTITGVPEGVAYPTNSNGYTTYNLNADSFRVIATKPGYFFPVDTIVFTGNDTFDIYGYDRAISTPSDTGYCNVYGYVYSQGQPVPYASVTLTLPSHAYDSCNNTILIDKVFTDKNGTDENGYFSITVPKSSCLNRDKDGDLMEYKAVAKKKGSMTKEYKFSIPADSSTYYLVF